jgi:FAD/FMN-containing dehydrogenase
VLDPTHLNAFHQMLGDRGVIAPGGDCAAYETPARYVAGRAGVVVRPTSTIEVSQVVAYCVRGGLRFVPQSGNTGLTGASIPDDSGEEVVLSLDRLAAPLDVRPGDRTAVVGAGVRMSALNAALEPHGLFLPIDLGADPMIGGMVATNTGGARFLRYGDMRRQVLGLEVVLADEAGTVLDLMTDLRKDNTRLDLKHLFIGSSGAFGVITKAVLEVHRRPERAATALIVPRDDEAVLEILLALEDRVGRRLSAFEGMSGAALACAVAHAPRLRNPFADSEIPPYLLLVEISEDGPLGDEPSLQDVLVEIVGEIAATPEASVADAYFDDGRQFWAIRHAISEGMRAAGRVVGLDLSFARSRVMAFRRAARAEAAAAFPEFEVCDFGHVADGGVHFNLLVRDPHVAAERLDEARAWALGLAVDEFGGSFSGEHGLGPVVQREHDRFASAQSKLFADRIQAALGVRPAARIRFGAPQRR